MEHSGISFSNVVDAPQTSGRWLDLVGSWALPSETFFRPSYAGTCETDEFWNMNFAQVLFQNDSLSTLLARVVGILGPIDPELLGKGRDTHKFFTKNHMLYERNQVRSELNREFSWVSNTGMLRTVLEFSDCIVCRQLLLSDFYLLRTGTSIIVTRVSSKRVWSWSEQECVSVVLDNFISYHFAMLAGLWPTWVPATKEDISVSSTTHGRPRLCWVRDLPSEHQPGSAPYRQWGPQTSVAVISLWTNFFMRGISISFFICLLREILQSLWLLSSLVAYALKGKPSWDHWL